MGGRDTVGVNVEKPKRRRFDDNLIWTTSFLEALAIQVTFNVLQNWGYLDVAPTLCNLLQVCPAWRAISESDILWEYLTNIVWNIKGLLVDTWKWRDEFINLHGAAINFHLCLYFHTAIPLLRPINDHPAGNGVPPGNNLEYGHICLRLALSNHYFAAGFSDGEVRLFEKATGAQVAIFFPEQRDRLGRFSSAVTGIILTTKRLIFASLDGDIRVVVLGPSILHDRVAHRGNTNNDGSLVDFTGDNRWWVGLYAGVNDRAFHVWNAWTEETVFIGGTLTNPEYLLGQHLHSNVRISVGRLTLSCNGSLVHASTARTFNEFSLNRNTGFLVDTEEYEFILDPDDGMGLMVRCLDSTDSTMMIMFGGRWLEMIDIASQTIRTYWVRNFLGVEQLVTGCLNNQHVWIYDPIDSIVLRIRRNNERLLFSRLHERLDEVTAMAADETHLLAGTYNTLYMWNFGA